MGLNIESKELDQLLADADALLEQINSDALDDLEEDHRLEFETYTQRLTDIKSKVHGKIDKEGTSEIGSGAEGMHEAILDIVRAMRSLQHKLSSFSSNAVE